MKADEAEPEQIEIKVVGRSGQISLGKRYAGKMLRLARHRDGTMTLTTVTMVPDHQIWTIEEPHRSRIQRGLAWAAENPPHESDLDEYAKLSEKARTPKRARRR